MDTEYLIYKTIGISSVIAFIIAMAVVHFYNQSQIIHEDPVEHKYVPVVQKVETVDTTEIMIDKKLFVCIGDIDLEVSDVGVVSFDCQTEEKKVHIVTNPQDMFVTQYLTEKEQ
jgi:hypothetical protein